VKYSGSEQICSGWITRASPQHPVTLFKGVKNYVKLFFMML